MNNVTFEHQGATYTVRPIKSGEKQVAVYRGLDLVRIIGVELGIPKNADTDEYPESLLSEVLYFQYLTMVTTIEGDPSHIMPAKQIDRLKKRVWEQWIEETMASGLYTQWVDAYDEANRTSAPPLDENNESESETNS